MRLRWKDTGTMKPVSPRALVPECVEVVVIDTPDDWAGVEVSFRMVAENGELQFDCLSVERPEGGRLPFGVMRMVLGVLPELVQQAVAEITAEDLGDGYLGEPGPDVIAEVVGTVSQRANAITLDKLARVKALYEIGGGIHAVMRDLDISRPHAYRLLKQARTALQPDDNPDKNKEQR